MQLVEEHFNQDFRFARAGNGRLIAYIDAVGTGTGRGFRSPGKELGRFHRGGALRRHVQVVMFILTPTVKIPKRIDIDSVAKAWADRVPGLLASNLRAT
jgi:hypothetical protein